MSSPDSHSHPPRPPAPPPMTGPTISQIPSRGAPRVEAPTAPRRAIQWTPGHSSSCPCSRCTHSRNTRPARPETRSTTTATLRSGYPARPTAATGPPHYAFPPLEPFWTEPPLTPHRRARRHPASTMSVASSHNSTEPSTNPNQRSAPPPHVSQNNPFLPQAQADPNQRTAPPPGFYAQRLQDQFTRAQIAAPRLGNGTTPPTNDQTQDRNPFSQPWNAIPTPEEMRAAQLRHHDAMLSDADHARFGIGRRRPTREPAADQTLANPLTRRHESSVRSGATPGRTEPSNRHRRSPHLLEDMLTFEEDDDDDESPDSLTARLLRNSRPPPGLEHETPDSLTARLLRDSRESSDQRPSRHPPLDLGRPDDATVVRRRRENIQPALRQRAENQGPTTRNPAGSRSTRELYELVRQHANNRGSGFTEELYDYLLGSRQNRRRLPANYVSTLPRVPISSLPDNEHDRRCDICWEDYEHLVDGERVVREEPVRLTCGHILGHVCATEYFTTPHTSDKPSTICPTCRQEPVLPRSAPAPVQARVAPAPSSVGNIPPPRQPIIPAAPITPAVPSAEHLARAQTSPYPPQPSSETTTAIPPRQPARGRAMSQDLADYMAWVQQRETGTWTLAQHEAHAEQNARVVGPPPRGGPSFAEYETWRRTEQARLEGWRLNSLGEVTDYADGYVGEDDEGDDDDEEDEYDYDEEEGGDGGGDEVGQ